MIIMIAKQKHKPMKMNANDRKIAGIRLSNKQKSSYEGVMAIVEQRRRAQI